MRGCFADDPQFDDEIATGPAQPCAGPVVVVRRPVSQDCQDAVVQSQYLVRKVVRCSRAVSPRLTLAASKHGNAAAVCR